MEKEIESTKAKIFHQFDGYQALPYRLYAVFIHHGSVNFGHYWIYIYDFKKNIWRKYNDTYVTEVQDPDEIFKCQEEQNPPTPYFLVYINDEMKDRLASPVHRDITKDQAPPPSQGHIPRQEHVPRQEHIPRKEHMSSQGHTSAGGNASGGSEKAFWDEWDRSVQRQGNTGKYKQRYGYTRRTRDAPGTGGNSTSH